MHAMEIRVKSVRKVNRHWNIPLSSSSDHKNDKTNLSKKVTPPHAYNKKNSPPNVLT
jgi:hypothetical protein